MKTLQELRDSIATFALMVDAKAVAVRAETLNGWLADLDAMLSSDMDPAHKKWLIQQARAEYCGDPEDVAVDDDARISSTLEDGDWVQGWLWVPKPTSCEHCGGEMDAADEMNAIDLGDTVAMCCANCFPKGASVEPRNK